MTARYRSPLRPLDIGWTARQAGVAIDWDECDAPGPWTRDRVYAFAEPLPDDMIKQLELIVREDCWDCDGYGHLHYDFDGNEICNEIEDCVDAPPCGCCEGAGYHDYTAEGAPA